MLISGLGGGLCASKGGGGDWKEVEGGGGDQREAATAKMSTRCSFSGLRVATRGNPENERLCSFQGSTGGDGWWASNRVNVENELEIKINIHFWGMGMTAHPPSLESPSCRGITSAT